MASSQPPPRAKPLTAAMTGLPHRSSRRIIACPASDRERPSMAPWPTISPMSAPATNALGPAPVRMTPRTAGSVSIRVTASSSSAMTAAFRALSLSGRLTVTSAMPSVRSKSRVEKAMVPVDEGESSLTLLWPRVEGRAGRYLHGMTIPTPIAWTKDFGVRILDQTLLPEQERYLELHSVEEVAEAIRMLRVRGAPLIGIAAAMRVTR